MGGCTYEDLQSKRLQGHEQESSEYHLCTGDHEPNCVLGLATGSTPIGTYDQLVEWYNKGDLDFSEVTTVNLDEYKGLPRTNDQSYYYFMHQHLFDRVNIDTGTDKCSERNGAGCGKRMWKI